MAPFPYLPMVAIAASLVSAMIVQMGVFVYAGFMVKYLGVVSDKDEAGYYAGALSAAYMIGRVCSSYAWGLIADRLGRRFVLVFGILSNIVLSVVFGCSATFPMAFITRFLLGLLNGVLVVARTLVSEICTTDRHERIGMGFVTCSWTVGGLLGPGIGGFLAEPAEHHPNLFSDDGIFGRYPYLLPNLVGSGLALLALPLVLVSIKDINNTQSAATGGRSAKVWCPSCCFLGAGGSRDDNDDGFNHGLAKINHELEANAEPAPAKKAGRKKQSFWMEREVLQDCDVRKPSWMQAEMSPSTTRETNGPSQDSLTLGHETKPEKLLAQGHIRILVFINAMYSFAFSGFDEVFPLWALSSAAKGGLDWSSPQIAKVFFTAGLMVLVFESSLGVPYLPAWLGAKTSQRLASIFEVPIYFMYPLLSHVSGDGHLRFALSAIGLFTAYACINSFGACVNLTLGNAVGKSRRAELNGISVTMESVTRAISPMACSMLFAFSINGNHPYPFGYHFAFYLLGTARLVAGCLGWNRLTDNGNME